MRKLKLLSMFLAATLLILLLTAQTFPRTPVGWLIAKRLTVNTSSTFNGPIVQPPVAIVATNGMALSPTASLHTLSSSGNVTITLAAPTVGTELELINTSNTTILIVDTGSTRMAGNFSMGQYDSIRFRRINSNWIETGRSNN